MSRVKRGPHRKDKRKRVLKLAKGYYGKKKNAYRIAKQAVDRALKFAYRDRRQKKRELRRLWIVRINAASRQNGLSYNRLINGLHRAGLDLNRKVLADIAVHDAEGFAAIVEIAKEGLEMETPAPRPEPGPAKAPKVTKKAAPAKTEEKTEKKAEPEKKKAEKAKKAAPADKAEKAEAKPKKAAAPKEAPKKEAKGPSKTELEKMTVADLKKLAEERGIAESDIEGSGANGNVVKADWVRTLAK